MRLTAYSGEDEIMFYLYALACFVLPGTLWIILNRKKLKENEDRFRHVFWSYIFIFYCFTAIYSAAGIGTVWDLMTYGKLDDTVNLIPFSSEGILTYALNVIMFMPLGFLLPFIWKNFRKVWKVVLIGFLMSLTIEVCQLFNFRATDIDDLIMNTLGTLLGFGCWALFRLIFRKAGDRAINIGRMEPYVYTFGSTMGLIVLYNWRLIFI